MRREVLCRTVVSLFSEPTALEKKSFETFSDSKLFYLEKGNDKKG